MQKFDLERAPVPTIKIGDVEVPRPMQTQPELDDEYWVLTTHDEPLEHVWDDDEIDHEYFKRRLIFKTREDAEAAQKAIIKLLGGTP